MHIIVPKLCYLFFAAMVNTNLDKRVNPSGQLFSNDTSCPFPITTASCAFSSGKIGPVGLTTLTKSADDYMESAGWPFSDASQTFSYLIPIFCVRSDPWWFLFIMTRHLPPLWSNMFAISLTILLQVSVLYAHHFIVSGFRVIFRPVTKGGAGGAKPP